MCVCVCVCACVYVRMSVGGGGGDSVGGRELRVGSNMIHFQYDSFSLYTASSHMAHVLFWCVYVIHCWLS